MKRFIFEHKFLFSSLVFSIFLGVAYYILYAVTFFNFSNNLIVEAFGTALLFVFAPVALTALVAFISCKTFLRHPKITKIASAIATSIILFLQLFVFLTLLYVIILSIDITCLNPDKYPNALEDIKRRDCISHFPKKIPDNASNIKFEKVTNNYMKYENVILVFDTNKKYISNELEKYNFIGVEKQGNYLHNYYLASKKVRTGIENGGFTFYVIYAKPHLTKTPDSSDFHCGIGVNEEENKIVYYYIHP